MGTWEQQFEIEKDRYCNRISTTYPNRGLLSTHVGDRLGSLLPKAAPKIFLLA